MASHHLIVPGLIGTLVFAVTAIPCEARLVDRLLSDAVGLPSASADSRFLAFTSDANLTGDDSDPPPSCLPPPFEDVCVAFDSDVYVLDRLTETIELISTTPNTGHGPQITADGRYVAFEAVDPTDAYLIKVYVYDRDTDSTEQVSVATSGAEADGFAQLDAISDDGRYVTFTSEATNLHLEEDGTQVDLFVRDLHSNTTTWIADAYDSDLSNDGRYVAYHKNAGGCWVIDRSTSTTTRVDVSTGGTPGNGNLIDGVSITPDGRYVVFGSDADNLVGGDGNGTFDVFLRDRVAGTTERVSVGAGGTEANGPSRPNYSPGVVSDDGRYVVFASRATSGLIASTDSNEGEDLFLRDRLGDSTERVTVGWLGEDAESDEIGNIYAVAGFNIAGATGEIIFASDSSNLVRDDDNGVREIFTSNDCISVPTCGNGVVDDFLCERCDDGNTTSEDGCSDLCLIESCNDGVVQSALGEQCDDYFNFDNDGCDASCLIEFCGDDIVQPGIGEECEPSFNPTDCEPDCLYKRVGCPYSLCDCLNEAGGFSVLTGKIQTKGAKFRVFGFPEFAGTILEGDACVETGQLAGILDAETEIDGNLYFRAGADDRGGKFKGYKVNRVLQPGTLIDGDLVSAGSEFKSLEAAAVLGATDVTGTHSGLASCLAAPSAVVDASGFLSTLTPVQQTFGKIKTKDDVVIQVGPGISVTNIEDINLRGYKEDGEAYGAYLTIAQHPATVLAVVNVSGKVSIANYGGIVTNGPAEQVVLNLHGSRSKLKVGKEGAVGVPVLAPNAKVTAKRESELQNIFCSVLSMQATQVTDVLMCSEN